MSQRYSLRMFVLIGFILPMVVYLFYTFFESRQELPVLGSGYPADSRGKEHTIENFELTNQEGFVKHFQDSKGKIVVANFFFTHCPVICPKMMSNLKKISSGFQQDTGVHLLSITIDPERDSPAQLKNYAQRFSIDTHNWDLLTGSKKEIYRLARNSFMVVATDGDGGADDFIHSDKLVLIDKIGRIRGFYNGTDEKEVNTLSIDIKKLQDEN